MFQQVCTVFLSLFIGVTSVSLGFWLIDVLAYTSRRTGFAEWLKDAKRSRKEGGPFR